MYAPAHDAGLLWNDPTLNIDWQINIKDIKLSSKDAVLPSLKQFESHF